MVKIITEDQIIQNISNDDNLSTSIPDIKEYPLPAPHIPSEKVKAFILGADPSNFSINGKETRKISSVFDIGRDKRYFSNINQNLQQVDLSINNVYVQNMVRNYMDEETQSNPKWNLFAEKWLPYIKQEFDLIDPAIEIPVLVTAEIVLRFLLLNPSEFGTPTDYYSGTKKIPITSIENKMERNLIPFYRHRAYSLKNQDYFRNRIKELLYK